MLESLTKTDLLAIKENALSTVAMVDKMLKKMPDEKKSEKNSKEAAKGVAYAQKQALKRYGKKAA